MALLVTLKKLIKRWLPRVWYVLSSVRWLCEFARAVALLRRLVGSVSSLPPVTEGVVLFNLVRTYVPVQLLIELALALKLRTKGYRVIILHDDGVMPHHDTLTRLDHGHTRPYYGWRRRLAMRQLVQLPVVAEMLVPYSELVFKARIDTVHDELVKGRGCCGAIDCSDDVLASLVRYYVSVADPAILGAEPDYRSTSARFMRNCAVSLAVAEAAWERFRPQLCVTSHGIYTSWSPFMKLMRTQGVRTITYGVNGFQTDAVDWAINDRACNKSSQGYFDHLLATLDQDVAEHRRILQLADTALRRRLVWDSDDLRRINSHRTRRQSEWLERVKAAHGSGRRVYGLFPNVMWDNATTFTEWNRVFASPVEWLVQTIAYFMNQANKMLVVRVHPAEASAMLVRRTVTDIVRHHLGGVALEHPNLLFIPAEAPLRSYDLFEYLSAGLVYNGTIGLELVYAGIPAVIAAKAAYSDQGFTHDVSTRRAYFAAIDSPAMVKRVQDEHRRRALVFMYEYFECHGVPLPFLSRTRALTPDYDCDPTTVLDDYKLDHIAEVITGKRRFFQEWQDPASGRENGGERRGCALAEIGAVSCR